jgi:hypothetical protein
MARHLFFAVTLMGIGVFLNSSAKAALDAPRCENNAANCVGRCTNLSSGTNDNKCMWYLLRHGRSAMRQEIPSVAGALLCWGK